jgi:GNAT superfamily N-acetyltransferase
VVEEEAVKARPIGSLHLKRMEIKEVTTGRELHEFLRLPWKVYRGNSIWVPPLFSDMKFRLDKTRNPFFDHARVQSFVLKENRETLGRITAIIDEKHNDFHHEKVGFFGFFECMPRYEIARVLFDAARAWCGSRGMKTLRGPMNPSMNDECAFLLQGSDSSPVFMMTYNPPYYLDYAEQYGFRKAKDLYAFLKQREPTPERVLRLMDRIKKKERLTVRRIDMKHFWRDVEEMENVYNSAWEKNWGFVPMSRKEFQSMAKRLKPLCVPDLVLIAEIEGNPVGIALTLPDYNQVLKRLNGKLGPLELLKFYWHRKQITGCRSLLFGVIKECRNRGIETVLYYETEQAAMRLGYQWCELSWNLEDNDLINRFDEAVGGKLYKKYRIMEMEI